MNSTICAQCRQALRQRLRAPRGVPSNRLTQSANSSSGIVSVAGPWLSQQRQNHTSGQSNSDPDIRSAFSKPAWSVRSLLPSQSSPSSTSTSAAKKTEDEITSKTLHHLLRLSALPPPRDARGGGRAPDDAADAAPLRTLDPERRHDGRGAPRRDPRRDGAGPAGTDDRARDPAGGARERGRRGPQPPAKASARGARTAEEGGAEERGRGLGCACGRKRDGGEVLRGEERQGRGGSVRQDWRHDDIAGSQGHWVALELLAVQTS
ncbi:Membrane dipeptidase GliJ [Apiospora arundinis]